MSAHRFGAILRHWHRRIGLFAFAFLFWLAASGVALNEGATLHLDAIRIDWPWLMQWYGLDALSPTTGFRADGHWLVDYADQRLLDGRPLQPPIRAPLGAVVVGGVLYVATVDSIVLLKPDGSRIDELRAPPLPVAGIRRIGTAGERIAIQDLDAYASADGEQWSAIAPGEVRWSQPQTLPEDVRTQIAAAVRPSLPLARVLADAHSGRLLGRYGTWLINAAAVAAMLLASSGIWMVWRASRRRRH
jgi:uncharacterized iron-regulated membrane protein